MTPAVAREAGWVSEVVAAYRAGRPLALLFDYDGTLTPIVRHPSLARLSAANRDRLARLAALPDVAVGVISGRALGEVRTFVGLEGLYYAGSGGLEVDLGGLRVEYPQAAAFRRVLVPLEEALLPVLARYPGSWMERKPVALALHYRGLSPVAAFRFRSETAAVLDRHPGVRHREVSEAIEVTPADGWDKGTAVEFVLGLLDPDVFAAYVGDAANDVEAMAVTGLTGGVAVGVGQAPPTVSTHRVASVEELEAWLDRMVRELPRARRLRPSLAGESPAGSSHAGKSDNPKLGEPELAPTHSTAPGVLVVDPDGAFRAEFAAAFRDLGWRVWTATESAGALDILRRRAGDIRVAVVDLQLSGLQGVRVLSELGHCAPHLVRCGMSAEVAAYTAAAFRRLSDTPLFAKPFDFQAVSATLRGLIGHADGSDRRFRPEE
jgi:trehalose-phosphatase